MTEHLFFFCVCVFFFFTAVDATLQEMGAYLLLPKTTKVHAALPTNLMACTVIHKTYINITPSPYSTNRVCSTMCSHFYSLVYKVYDHHIFQTKCYK